MWQRVQTLYLAIALVLTGVLFFSTKAVIPGADGQAAGSFLFREYTPYVILLVVITALNLLALTTYRFRVFQMRTATLSALITLALQVWILVDFLGSREEMVFRVSAVFPLVSIIFLVLAIRGIFADEMLVQSAYSLRKSRSERRR